MDTQQAEWFSTLWPTPLTVREMVFGIHRVPSQYLVADMGDGTYRVIAGWEPFIPEIKKVYPVMTVFDAIVKESD